MAEPDPSRILVVGHPDDADAATEVERLLAERGLQLIVPEPLKRSTFEGDLAGADAVVLVAGPSGLDEWKLPAVERRLAGDPAFRVVVAVAPGAKVTRLPPQIESAPVVRLAERDGIEHLAALLAASEPAAELRLSPSVTRARLTAGGPDGRAVTAHRLALEIAALHPEYGSGTAQKLLSATFVSSRPERPVDDWLRDVRRLVSPAGAAALHGRAVMLGLGLLDADLRSHYRELGFEQALVAELRLPLPELLTERGLVLWEEREEPPRETPTAPAGPEETVPTHTDNPATVDELGREGLARVLARRIRDMREQEEAGAQAAGDEEHPRGRSFLVHVHAPWGMGKTSLLNFLRRELGPESENPWVVVDFNAWRHQRVAPPWWWLMTALYQQGRRELAAIDRPRAWALRVREWWWRGLLGWLLLVLAVAAVGALVWQSGWVEDLRGSDSRGETVTGFLVSAAAIVVPLTTLWMALQRAGNWLLTATPRSGRAYVQASRDPMETVQRHFADLVEWLHYPVIVLVDDLDRCRGEYVVELLEGIQTLFRDQPVAYVVAADRDWLSDAYQAAYGDFVSAADEPGRPLGYLFLEKTFQMSVTLAPPAQDVRDGYWHALIRPGERIDRGELERERKTADAAFAGLASEAAVRAELEREPGASPVQALARREAAAIQLATPALAREAEHALRPFAILLDPNPRAMKRLVNAYGIARGIETLAGQARGGRAAQQETALWTILALRWPRLADHLARRPEDAAAIAPGANAPDGVPEDLAALFGDPQVAAVARGEGDEIEARLDAAAVGRCAGQIQV